MMKIRESITLWQFIATSIINIADTILFFLISKLILNFDALKHLTNISLFFNASYLFLAYICDICIFIFKSKKLEGFNYFLRYKFYNIINPISYLVLFFFSIFVLMEVIKNAFANHKMTLYSIYAHYLIPFFVLCDIFISEHDMHTFSWITYGFILLFNLIYIIIIIICQTNKIYTYDFLKKISIFDHIMLANLFIGSSFGCYMLHIFIIHLKYKYIIKNKEKQHFNEEINKIIQIGDVSKESNQ